MYLLFLNLLVFQSVEKGGYIMITELSAQNFKSWQDTGKLQLAPLTGLFGANNSGKTSILQVLLMLKQTAEHPSPDWNEPLYFGDEESLVNLGSYDDVIHQHNKDLDLNIAMSWKLPEKVTVMDEYQFDTLSLNLRHSQKGIDSFSYKAGGQLFEVFAIGDKYEVTTPQSKDPVESLFRCYGIYTTPLTPRRSFSCFREAFENLVAQIRYLGPLREPLPHRYIWEGDHPKGIGKYGEQAISALLSRRVQNRPIDEQIPKWLKRLKLINSYRLNPLSDTGRDYEFLVQQYENGPEVRLTDVGFGVSQVLPVLIHCYSAPKDSILIIEQPEAHLHPSAQSELADVLIDVVKNRNVQIILESHSEHLLLRLMRRIAEEDKPISAEDTALYFCQINDGTSEIERLDVNEYGSIRNWPQDFFGDSTGELIKKTKAEMQRRKVMR